MRRRWRQQYALRWERRYYVARGRWKRRELRAVADRTGTIRPQDLLVFSSIRNEAARLPFFLDHYRRMGIDHFLIVDNGSTDGGDLLLADQPDVSLWHTEASYRASRYSLDWINGLLCRYGHGHWTLTVDADELLVYPFCDCRPLRALTDWLDSGRIRSMGAMLVDLYPQGPLSHMPTAPGDPVAALGWFDAGNYVKSLNHRYRNLWIQGGPRMRAFFADEPKHAPALNKTPLVRWNRRYAFVQSTHMLLPRGLNEVYATDGGEKLCGALLHTKFTEGFAARAKEEAERGEHYAAAQEYGRYAQAMQPRLWTEQSTRYRNWRQLDELGLISTGGWA